MLLTSKLIEGVEEKYVGMLKSVNIPDFYKCVAVFSGLTIGEISEDAIKDYLITWAHNKYRFYQMLGNKTKKDLRIEYQTNRNDIKDYVKVLGKEFPAYYLWLLTFGNQRENKIDVYQMDWSFRMAVNSFLGSEYQLEGTTMTHFFKSKLNAPDELVTKIAAIFENDTIKDNFTISIDPIDIMTASENPYNWTSCYRLETENSESHADGCMAALLDTQSLITYIWGEEGKLDLYGDYELKNVRYKKMRKWIAISPKFTSIHFNNTYPGKRTSPDEFEKTVRQLVEGVVAAHAGLPDKWRRAQYADAGRDYLYGYGEFHDDNIYVNVAGAEQTEESILAYDTGIKCACGCGEVLIGSGEADDGYRYQGNGFTHDCMVQYYWCDLADDWCNETDGCGSHCRGCSNWDRNHPTCELNSNIECPDVPSDFWDYTDWDVTEVQAEESHCKGCPHWESCHSEEDEDDCCED